jgi:uncharacterized protein YndB with AHSA1/START domain
MSPKGNSESTEGERMAVRISRDFEFPREAVFGKFTDKKNAAALWSPQDADQVLFELDPRPGGVIRIHDRDREGRVHKTTGSIVELVAPEMLVVKTSTAPAGGAAPWEALQTLTFQELGPRKTRLTILVKVLATGSFPGDAASLGEGYQGGWGEVLEKLQMALA